ncbi:SH3 domain-binding protein 5 isoform X2 [Gadus chalcogrammus]|uniref:SH3 domain-binding protein 5 isoform X2 n=1 Tax=Gadus chalcogrammus TaxID=1042646 RepID=UPI0024C4B6EF|nr:SH3 domain-binding protein 5 isoform X2 [Gadus chalcogrammus]
MEQSEARSNFSETSELPEEEAVDPRIQGELERLNQSTDGINRWECELEDYRQRFRAVLVEATVKLDEQTKKIGRAVDDSKPYWEARRVARQAQLEAQKATQEFQRAVEILRAAKETIALAEERLLEEDSRQFDSAWQEMLNHATQRVMEAELARTRSEAEHKKTAANYNSCIGHMKQLEKKLKRNINKSRPYFELKAKYYIQLEQLKRCVDERQTKLASAKAEYRTALSNLEAISEEIHAQRRTALSTATRERGVGSDGDGEGDHEDIANFKMESDGLSNPSNALTVPCPYPSSSSLFVLSTAPCPLSGACPSSLELRCTGEAHGPDSLCDSGHVSPVLGPRSQCSGASSPDCDCDQERGDRAEGAEAALGAGLKKLTLTAAHADARQDDHPCNPDNPEELLPNPSDSQRSCP